MRYKITRIGLLNFWLYDDEEFDFSDGKLLLRGKNGSGKSVTMQSFIPLILDGNKSPARLDPFGSTDKHIEAYLLGGIDTEQKEEATGYLYMEVYLEEKLKYVTIGMGLHARRGRPVNFFGFALEDGRRIGRDFFLYKNKVEKVPLTKNELRASLGAENTFVETTKEYKKMVNQLLFGFPNLDSYDEFINVLLQLRSPKLSKEYKPTKLMSILSSVLQPLTEEDLRPLSDAVEEMDKTKEKIEQLESDVKLLSNLMKTYTNYNETVLYQKADRYLAAIKDKEKEEKTLLACVESLEKEKRILLENEEEFHNLEVELARVKAKRENLDSRDLDQKVSRLDTLRNLIKENEEKQRTLQAEIARKQEKRNKIEEEIRILDDQSYEIEKEAREQLEEITASGDVIKFQEPSIVLKDLEKEMTSKVDFSYLGVRLEKYQNRLRLIRDHLLKKKECEEKASEHQKNYDQLAKEYQTLTNQAEKLEDETGDALRNIKDEILLLTKNNQLVKVTEEERKKIFSYLQHYDSKSFILAKEYYQKIAQSFYQEKLDEVYRLKDKMAREKEKIAEMRLSLETLRKKEEDELPHDEEEEETYLFLEREGISYLPFYKAIEFKNGLDERTKNSLESHLLSMGLLGALIIKEKDKEKVRNHKGSYLFPHTKKKENLTKYFVAIESDEFSKKEIEAVLESISTSSHDTVSINEKGYRVDSLIGYGKENKVAKYIGLLARLEEQKRKIKEKEDQLAEEEAILNNLDTFCQKRKEECVLIEQERKSFPQNETLEKLEDEKKKVIIHLDIVNGQQLKEEEAIRQLTDFIHTLFKELSEWKKDIALPLYLETFDEALKEAENLKVALLKIEATLKEYSQKQEVKQSKKEQLDDLCLSLDEVSLSLSDLSLLLEKDKKEADDLQEILNTDEYKDLSKELLEMAKKLEDIPKQEMRLKEEHGQHEKAFETLEQEKIDVESILGRQEKIVALHEKFFEEEYNLSYVMEKTGETAHLAKEVLSKLAHRKNSTMLNATNNYYAAYSEYRLSLNDYHLSSITLFEKEVEDDDEKSLYEEAKRSDLRVMYQGKKLTLYALEKTLKDAILENHQIISEQDRKIFEEILLKTVGSKIRDRIASSREWVRKMNDIMKTMQEDSALSFQLEWRSKGAEAMEEIDSKELVRIFQIDASMISEEDSEKLINHFRSKLKRKVDLSSQSHDTYSNIIFEVLDYRNWFEFKMMYQRAGEGKRELTDKVFSVFSGGEKAKAMYIPLFAAVYAKLLGARPTALRVVALDEAFAGVDDSNIREMFGIMSSLDLDYILTSQALWGDYDTIKDLAIVELLRPNNASVVGLRRYHWNGSVKEVVLKKGIDQDAISIF